MVKRTKKNDEERQRISNKIKTGEKEQIRIVLRMKMENKKHQKIRDKIMNVVGILCYIFLSIFFLPLTFAWWTVNDESFMDSNIFGNILHHYKNYGGNV